MIIDPLYIISLLEYKMDDIDIRQKLYILVDFKKDFTENQCAEYDFEITHEMIPHIDHKIIGKIFNSGYIKLAKKILFMSDIILDAEIIHIMDQLSACLFPKLIKKIIKILKPIMNKYIILTKYHTTKTAIVQFAIMCIIFNNNYCKYIINNYTNLNLYSNAEEFYERFIDNIKYCFISNELHNCNKNINYIRKYQLKYKYIFLCKNILRR